MDDDLRPDQGLPGCCNHLCRGRGRGGGGDSCVRQWSLLGPTWTESAEEEKGRLAFQSPGL